MIELGLDTELNEYVKPELVKEFKKLCAMNSTDSYSSGCITSALTTMEELMEHKFKSKWKTKKCTPKEAWDAGMNAVPGHSCMSAAGTATIIAKYSPRGKEFKNWCKKNDIVMVNWNGKKN